MTNIVKFIAFMVALGIPVIILIVKQVKWMIAVRKIDKKRKE